MSEIWHQNLQIMFSTEKKLSVIGCNIGQETEALREQNGIDFPLKYYFSAKKTYLQSVAYYTI
jgi:hypothetical protein